MEDHPSNKKMLESIESSMSASHKAKRSGDFDSQKNSHPTKVDWRRLQIMVKLSDG